MTKKVANNTSQAMIEDWAKRAHGSHVYRQQLMDQMLSQMDTLTEKDSYEG